MDRTLIVDIFDNLSQGKIDRILLESSGINGNYFYEIRFVNAHKTYYCYHALKDYYQELDQDSFILKAPDNYPTLDLLITLNHKFKENYKIVKADTYQIDNSDIFLNKDKLEEKNIKKITMKSTIENLFE